MAILSRMSENRAVPADLTIPDIPNVAPFIKTLEAETYSILFGSTYDKLTNECVKIGKNKNLVCFDYNAAVGIWDAVLQLVRRIQQISSDECPMARVGDVKAFHEDIERWRTDMVAPLPEHLPNPNLVGDQYNPLIGAHSKKDMWNNFNYCIRTGKACLQWLLECFNKCGPGSDCILPLDPTFRFDFSRVYSRCGGRGYVNAIQSRAATVVSKTLFNTIRDSLVGEFQQNELKRINEKNLVGFAHLEDYINGETSDSEMDESINEPTTHSESSSQLGYPDLSFSDDEDFAKLSKAITSVTHLEDPNDLQVVIQTDHQGRGESQPPITGFKSVKIHFANALPELINSEMAQVSNELETAVTERISQNKDDIVNKIEDLVAWGYFRGAKHTTEVIQERLKQFPQRNRLEEFVSVINLDALIASAANSKEPSPTPDVDPQPPRYSPVEHFERKSSKRKHTPDSRSHPYKRQDKGKAKEKFNFSTDSHF